MSDYITKATIKADYGLTDSLIKKLGEPDKVVPNPHYRSSAPMQLYLRERVEQFVEDNAETIKKILARRKKQAEAKPPSKPPEPPRLAPEYRQNVRQIGEKWSWSVYQASSKRVLKSGWADSEEEAHAACSVVVQEAKKEKRAKYFDYEEN